MTTRAGGLLVVLHSAEGKMIVKIERSVCAPMLQVSDSAGDEFLIAADDYEKANVEEIAEFYAAKRQAVEKEVVRWN